MWCKQEKLIVKTFGVLALFLTVAFAIVSPAWADDNDNSSASNNDTDLTPFSDVMDLQAVTRVPMYRIYNTWTGEHLYTSKASERDSNVKLGWKDEGIEWYAPSTSSTPVYRLYNPYTSDHHYTTKKSEYDSLAKGGWKQEGISWYSLTKNDAESYPLYRQYNPFASTGTHNYTKDTKERDNLIKLGWKDEGVGWYGYKTSKAATQQIDFTKATVDTANKTYTAKQIKPAAKISGLTANKDYTVTYGTNKTVGKGTITIKGIGSYTGTKTYNFNIVQKEITAVSGITASNKVYDRTTSATVSTAKAKLTGVIAGDSVTATATGTFADKNAGNNKTVNVTISGLSGTSAKNYKLKSSAKKVTAKANITQKPVMANGIKASDKKYDGGTKAQLDASSATLLGVLDGDTVTFSGGEGVFEDKNAGENKKVEVTGLTLGGTDCANYKINEGTQAANVKATISPRPATITGLKVDEKVYNASEEATVNTEAVSIEGLLGEDEVILDTAKGEFVASGDLRAKDAGTDKPVKLELTFKGADKDNYKIENPEVTGNITTKTITVDYVYANNKNYDNSDVATINKDSIGFSGKEDGDDLTVDTDARFASKNVTKDADGGNKQKVTVRIKGLLGEDKNNYYTEPTILESEADLNPIEVGVTGVKIKGGSGSKEYDGKVECELDTEEAKVNGVLSGDEVGVTATGAFEDKNVGRDKTIKVSATLTGTNSGNYEIPEPEMRKMDFEADITAKPVTVTGITAKPRTYNGTTDITLLTDGASINGKVTGDDLDVTASSELPTKNAGTQTVTFTPTFVGNDKDNYVLKEESVDQTVNVEIAKVEIGTVTGITSSKDKTYDGTTDAICDATNATFAEKIEGDEVIFTVTGTYDQADAGTDVPMTVSVSSELGGKDGGNYNLDASKTTQSGKGIINQREVVVDKIAATAKTYDGNAKAEPNYKNVTISNLIKNATTDDTKKVSVTADVTFQKDRTCKEDDGSASDSKYAKVSNIKLVAGTDGDASGNYKLAETGQQTVTFSQINKREITVNGISIVDGGKYYDGQTSASCDTSKVEFGNTVNNDADNLGVIIKANYDTPDVGAGKEVTWSSDQDVDEPDMMLNGEVAGNYTIKTDGTQTETTGDVKARVLKVTEGIYFNSTYKGNAQHKAYDGKTTANLGCENAKLEAVVEGYGIVEGETLTVEATGNFETKDWSTEKKTINISDYQLKLQKDDGTEVDATNYTVDANESQSTCEGYIDQRNVIKVKVKGITAKTKTYDSTTNVTFDDLAVNSSNIIPIDPSESLDPSMTNFTVKIEGHLNSKNAQSPQIATITNITLEGDDATIYEVDLEKSDKTVPCIVNQKPITAVTGITADDKEYNGNNTATINTTGVDIGFTGKIAGDKLQVKDGATGLFTSASAGENKTVNISNIELDGDDAGNYSLTDDAKKATATASIDKKKLTVSGLTAEPKNYDGKATATLSGDPKISGVIDADEGQVTVSGVEGEYVAAEGALAKDAGKNKKIKFTKATLGGDQAGNYELDLDQDTGLTADINAISLTVNGIKVVEKDYNQKTDDVVFNYDDVKFNGLIEDVGDELSVTATGTYDDKAASDESNVTISELTLSGTGARNYNLQQYSSQTSATGKVNTCKVTISGLKGVERKYDGTDTVEMNVEDATLNTILTGDDCTLGEITGTIKDREGKEKKDAGENIPLSVDTDTCTLNGNDAGNYELDPNNPLEDDPTVTITPVVVTPTFSSYSFESKTYDPNDANITVVKDYIQLDGVVDGEDVAVDTVTCALTNPSDIHAGSNDVTISSITYTGTAANSGNYTLSTTSATATIDIAKKQISTLDGVSFDNKTYDATTKATLSSSASPTSTDVYSVDTAGVTFNVTGKFATKNVGVGRMITYTVTLSGDKASNYEVSDSLRTTASANITAKTVTYSGIKVKSRAWKDDETSAELDFSNVKYTGIVGSDDAKFSENTYTANFSTGAAGSDLSVAISGLSLTGNDAGNYELNRTTASGVATIYASDATELAISGGMTATSKTYDGNKTITVTCASPSYVVDRSATRDPSTATLTVNIVAEVADKNVGNRKAVTIKSVYLTGSDSCKFKPADLTDSNWQSGLTANIYAKEITISGITANDKLWDGTTSATFDTSDATLGSYYGDDVSIASVTGAFESADAGTGKTVNITGFTLSGADKNNYSASLASSTTTATIRTPVIVTFNTGKGGSEVPEQIIEVGGTATQPDTNPTRDGYTFVSWCVDETSGQNFDFNKALTENTVIYAGWAENEE